MSAITTIAMKSLTCNDVDVRDVLRAQIDGLRVCLKGLAQHLLLRLRAAETVEPDDVKTALFDLLHNDPGDNFLRRQSRIVGHFGQHQHLTTCMQSLTRRGTRKPLASFSRTVSRLTPNNWPKGAIVLVDLPTIKIAREKR